MHLNSSVASQPASPQYLTISCGPRASRDENKNTTRAATPISTADCVAIRLPPAVCPALPCPALFIRTRPPRTPVCMFAPSGPAPPTSPSRGHFTGRHRRHRGPGHQPFHIHPTTPLPPPFLHDPFSKRNKQKDAGLYAATTPRPRAEGSSIEPSMCACASNYKAGIDRAHQSRST